MVDEVFELITSNRDSDGDICHYELPEEFVLVDEGDWTQEHKYQVCENVVEHKPSGRFFCISRSRSGSYHSDWFYSEAYVSEVVKVEKTIVVTEWEPK